MLMARAAGVDGESFMSESRRQPATFLGHPLNKYDIDEITPTEDGAAPAGSLRHLTALSLTIPTAQKSLQQWDQTVRDEQGRRRFHGAFTGGFSAGYFNTVGSAKGWKPCAFQSSRSDRVRDNKKQRVEDFMDEEDYENMTTGGAGVQLVSAATGIAASTPQALPTREAAFEADSDESIADVLPKLLFTGGCHGTVSLAFAPPGLKILRSMGWREGMPGVMCATLLRAPKPPVDDNKKKRRPIGPQLPSTPSENNARASFKDDVRTLKQAERSFTASRSSPSGRRRTYQDDEKKTEAWLERRRAHFEQLVSSTHTLSFLGLKKDQCGLGYDKRVGKRSLLRERAHGHRPLSRGGFGTGILDEERDDEWDTIYDDAGDNPSQRNFSFSRQKKGLLLENADIPCLADVSALHSEDDNTVLPEHRTYTIAFVEAKMKTDRSSHASQLFRDLQVRPPAIPLTFKGVYSPSKTEIEHEKNIRRGQTSAVVARLVDHLKRYRKSWVEVRDDTFVCENTKEFTNEGQPRRNQLELSPRIGFPAFVERQAMLLDSSDRKREKEDPQQQQRRNAGCSESHQQPLWSAVTNETKKAMIHALFPTAKFVRSADHAEGSSGNASQPQQTRCYRPEDNVQFPDDPEKQRRYQLFCLALEEKVSPSEVLNAQKSLDPSAASAERGTFGVLYKKFRHEYPHVELMCPSREGVSSTSGTSLVSQQSQRLAWNWRPDKIICKRFGVHDPWDKKEFVDDRPLSVIKEAIRTKSFESCAGQRKFAGGGRLGEAGEHQQQKDVSRSTAFVDGLMALIKKTSGEEHHQDLSCVSSPFNQPLCITAASRQDSVEARVSRQVAEKAEPDVTVAPRPPLSIFKSVFGDEGDEESQEDHGLNNVTD